MQRGPVVALQELDIGVVAEVSPSRAVQSGDVRGVLGAAAPRDHVGHPGLGGTRGGGLLQHRKLDVLKLDVCHSPGQGHHRLGLGQALGPLPRNFPVLLLRRFSCAVGKCNVSPEDIFPPAPNGSLLLDNADGQRGKNWWRMNGNWGWRAHRAWILKFQAGSRMPPLLPRLWRGPFGTECSLFRSGVSRRQERRIECHPGEQGSPQN